MIKDRFAQNALAVFIDALWSLFVLRKGLILGVAGIGVVI